MRRTTPIEMARRSALIVDLYRRGHSTREIARAVDIGVSRVCEQLRSAGMTVTKRYKGAGEVTEPCAWRDEHMPRDVDPDRRWERSSVIRMVEMLNDDFRESSFANVLANHVTEAQAARDIVWLGLASDAIDAALEKLGRARRILDDGHYRETCRVTGEGVEALRERTEPVRLRAVQ